jgi:hypothetical protein
MVQMVGKRNWIIFTLDGRLVVPYGPRSKVSLFDCYRSHVAGILQQTHHVDEIRISSPSLFDEIIFSS